MDEGNLSELWLADWAHASREGSVASEIHLGWRRVAFLHPGCAPFRHFLCTVLGHVHALFVCRQPEWRRTQQSAPSAHSISCTILLHPKRSIMRLSPPLLCFHDGCQASMKTLKRRFPLRLTDEPLPKTQYSTIAAECTPSIAT